MTQLNNHYPMSSSEKQSPQEDPTKQSLPHEFIWRTVTLIWPSSRFIITKLVPEELAQQINSFVNITKI